VEDVSPGAPCEHCNGGRGSLGVEYLELGGRGYYNCVSDTCPSLPAHDTDFLYSFTQALISKEDFEFMK